MREFLVFAIFTLGSCSPPPADAEPLAPPPPTDEAPVAIAATVVPEQVRPGGEATLWLRFATLPTWHVDPPEASGDTGLRLELEPTSLVRAGAWRFPPALPGPEDPRPVLTGDFAVACPVRVAPDARSGRHLLRVTIAYVACDPFRCNPPAHRVVEAPLEVR